MKIKRAPVKFRYFFTLLVIALTAAAAFSQVPVTLPTPTGYVNDFAGVMDPAVKQQLEARLKAFKEKTNPSVELAVAVLDTTGDRPIFDYSLQLAREWKIGSKEDDNPGILLIVAISDRKYYTQVSRNLEDELSDGLVGQIQRQYLVPEFKQGNYSKGIADTIDAYIKTIEAKQTGAAPPKIGATKDSPAGRSGKGSNCVFIGCAFIFIIIVIIVIGGLGRRGRGRKDNDRWGGGGGFGGGGSVLPWVAGAIIGNMLGGSSSGSSSSSDWGGSSGGGGSDWGGFGGGGDFGGGGAGGDW